MRDGRLAAAIAQLTPLLAFMQRHTQLFERADDSRSPADGAEAAQLQALVQRTLEAAHFVHFLADHDLRAIARRSWSARKCTKCAASSVRCTSAWSCAASAPSAGERESSARSNSCVWRCMNASSGVSCAIAAARRPSRTSGSASAVSYTHLTLPTILLV